MTKDFVETTAVKIVRAAIERAKGWQYPSRVISDPGMGKTTALRHFERATGAIYCQVKARFKDTPGMYLMLMEAYGLRPYRKTAREHGEQIYRDLGGYSQDWDGEKFVQTPLNNRPLLVDEYQTLEATALRELLNIAEECAIPLVLCGNGERLANEKRNERPALEQIWSRVRPTYRIEPPGVEDCRAFAIVYDVEFTHSTYDALAAYGSQTSIRDLACLLQEARAIVGSGPIALRHIETAVRTIYGRENALQLLSPPIAA